MSYRHCRLLRSRHERPTNGCAAERGYELPPSDLNRHLPGPRKRCELRNLRQAETSRSPVLLCPWTLVIIAGGHEHGHRPFRQNLKPRAPLQVIGVSFI
jgi:hypothetical protein